MNMGTFSYKAKDQKGNLIEGILEAEHRSIVINRLQAMGYFPVEIIDDSTLKKERPSLASLLRRKVSLKDLVNFDRQLADLINAGVPLVRALNVLVNQTFNPYLRQIIDKILQDVQEGESLAKALGKHPKVFDKLFCAMVKAGERGGFLDVVLQRLAELAEKEQEIKSKVKTTLAYPVVMIIASIGAIIILMTVVVPKIVKIFQELQQTLPLPTQILISLSWWMGHYWWLLLGSIGLLVIIIWNVIQAEEGRRVIDRLKLRLPILGLVILKQEIGRFARTLGSLLANGVPILEALEITKDVATNKLVEVEVDKIIQEVTQGSSVARVMRSSNLFPPVMVNMIAVGEETARLPEVLGKVATSYEMEVDRSLKMLTALIEPLIILIMGVVVAFIVISILLPIFNLDPTL